MTEPNGRMGPAQILEQPITDSDGQAASDQRANALRWRTSSHRPTELFRSCNVQSDQGAMSDFKLWSNGTIKMPYMNIPVLDIRKCLPDMWKAVACSLQIKPCHIKSRGSLICKYGSSATSETGFRTRSDL